MGGSALWFAIAACDAPAAEQSASVATTPPSLPVEATAEQIVVDSDDAGAPLPAPSADARIVSLTPSATELLATIGRLEALVGRTTWDDYPAGVTAVADLGPGLRPNVEAVLAARPTHVVLYASPDNAAAADAFRAAGITVVQLRTTSLADLRRNARVLGHVFAADAAAAAFVDSIDRTLARVREVIADAPRPRVVWPSWDAPVMVVGGDSYEHELLTIAGAENVFGDRDEVVATVTLEEIARRDPDAVLAAPGRIERLRTHDAWRSVRAVREGRLLVLDTTVIGRPGARVGMAAVALAKVLHPDRAARLP